MYLVLSALCASIWRTISTTPKVQVNRILRAYGASSSVKPKKSPIQLATGRRAGGRVVVTCSPASRPRAISAVRYESSRSNNNNNNNHPQDFFQLVLKNTHPAPTTTPPRSPRPPPVSPPASWPRSSPPRSSGSSLPAKLSPCQRQTYQRRWRWE